MKNANTLSGPIRALCGVLVLWTGLGWHLAAAESSGKTAAKSVNDTFAVKLGDKELRLQFAVSPSELQRGLMFRRSMKPDEGMLFVFEKPQTMSFYMRNTSLPLHIGYFDAGGILREIYPLYPHDETSVKSRSDELQYALEVNQGWFKENQVRPGAQLDLKAVKAALQMRGFDPADFGFRK